MNTERETVVRAQRGDARAFSLLVQQYERAVMTLCSRYLRSTDAEDAAQDAFVRAFQHLDRFDLERPFAPWLYQIARRVCLDRLRKRKAEAPEAAGGEPVAPVLDPSVRIDAETAVRVLQTLDEGPREALALFHLHELSYEEIAQTLEVPIGTVMTWIHRGRGALREALGEKKGAAK